MRLYVRNWAQTLSQDSRPWNRVLAATDQSAGKNLVHFWAKEHKFCAAQELASDAFRSTLATVHE